jgi:AMMECR1 domain-containing protein
MAAFQDPRFPPVTTRELPQLFFQVSVLHSMEAVAAPSEHDTNLFGVVVSTPDGRRGVLLPGIEEIKTAAEQLRLARKKGGIQPSEPVAMWRFQVDHFSEPTKP